MATYIQDGKIINYRNSGAEEINFEDVVVLTNRIGVATINIPSGALGTVAISGVYEIPADGTTAFTVGQTIYWDETNKRLTSIKADSGAIVAGIAIEPKATSETIALVRLGG